MSVLSSAICNTLRLTRDFERAASDLDGFMNGIDPAVVLRLPKFSMNYWLRRPKALERTNCYHFAVGGRLRMLELEGEGPIEKLSPGEIRFRYEHRAKPNARALVNTFVHHVCDTSEGDFLEFVSETVNGAVHDGLIPIGGALQVPLEATPLMVFFSERWTDSERMYHDHHWYGLRNVGGQPVRLSKFAGDRPVIHPEASDVFKNAESEGYGYFGGYVLRPHDLEASLA